MARALLQIIGSAENVLKLTAIELAWALLEDMQARAKDPTAGMASRDALSASLISVSTAQSMPTNMNALCQQIDKSGQKAFEILEQLGLAEAAHGVNGKNGYLMLTDAGRGAERRTDFESIRLRCLLKEEMLHQLLRGRIFGYFTENDLGTAVFEAFKTVEIEVRNAGGFGAKLIGKQLMFKAFAIGGPLAISSDDKSDCEALSGLFASALHRFRNPGGHTHRTYQDALEAMEELMFASRLLRIVDERRRGQRHRKSISPSSA